MNRCILDHLKTWKDNPARKPLILSGARQVGKTWALKAFGARVFPRSHYINFEEERRFCSIFDRDLNPGRILKDLAFATDCAIDPSADFLILDEIQECPRALTSLKYFAEAMPRLALCAAGSMLGVHLSDSSFPVGKVDLLTLHPMTFMEFLEGIGDAKSADFLRSYQAPAAIPEVVHGHLWERLRHYFVIGGLPEAVKIWGESQEDPFLAMQKVRQVQRTLLTAYLADMAKHAGKQNSMQLERVFRNVPSQLARTQDGSAPKYRFKAVVPGVQGYERLSGPIDWLQAGRLLLRTRIAEGGILPLSAFSSENRFKLYVFDVGILGALSGLQPRTLLEWDFRTYKGYFAENFVAQEFTASGEEPLYAWCENTAEVEFLHASSGAVLPVEVKSGGVTQAKSLGVYARKYAPPYRTILSANNVRFDDANGVHRLPLYLAGRFPLLTVR